MKRSSRTPATFIAMPCTPVGRPKRNSDRMIVQSGRQSIDREKLDDAVAAEEVIERVKAHRARRDRRPHRRAGRAERRDRPEAADQEDVENHVQHRHRQTEPQRRPRIAGGPERRRQHEEQQHADAEGEVDPQERQRLRLDVGRGIDEIEQPRRREVADAAHHDEHPDRRQERLLHDLVDAVANHRRRQTATRESPGR